MLTTASRLISALIDAVIALHAARMRWLLAAVTALTGGGVAPRDFLANLRLGPVPDAGAALPGARCRHRLGRAVPARRRRGPRRRPAGVALARARARATAVHAQRRPATRRRREGCRMSVLALGLDHTTAPLDVRGRFAFPGDELVPALRAFRGRLQRAAEVAIVSTCNRTELYVGTDGGRPRELAEPRARLAGRVGGMAADDTAAALLRARGRRRRAPRLPARQRAGVDGRRRDPDPRPDEAGGARGRRRRHARHARCTSCSSARSRSPRRCAAAPRSACTRSAWRPRSCASPASCSRTSASCACCSRRRRDGRAGARAPGGPRRRGS